MDRLWFFLGLDPQHTRRRLHRFVYRQLEDPQTGGYRIDDAGEPLRTEAAHQAFTDDAWILRFVLKLTASLTSRQRLSLSYFGDPSQSTGPGSGSVGRYLGEPSTFLASGTAGSHNVVLAYSGRFFERRLSVEGRAGFLRATQTLTSTTPFTPAVTIRSGGVQIPEPICAQELGMRLPTCPVTPRYRLGGGLRLENVWERGSATLKLSLLLPRNQVKLGADLEWNTFRTIRAPSGGQSERWEVRALRDLDGDGIPDQELVRRVAENGYVRRGPGGAILRKSDPDIERAFTRSFAFFLQDSVRLSHGLTFNAGFRWEVQELRGTAGDVTLEDPTDPTSRMLTTVLRLGANLAPRAGLIWDPFGEGRTKIFGSFGVFYEAIPLAPARDGLSTTGTAALSWLDFRGRTLAGPFFRFGQPFGIQESLSPQYHYEWLAGVEHELLPALRLGLSYTKRVLGNVIEDLSVDEGATYFLGNPGHGPTGAAELRRLAQDRGATVDSRCRFRDPDVRESLTCTGDFPEAVRDYDAWTLSLVKRRTPDQPWHFLFSYTLSSLRGNYSGLFFPERGQNLPNLTAQFDHPSLLENSHGPLANDHRHIIKLFGSYQLPRRWLGRHELIVGVGLNAESGGPYSLLGGAEFPFDFTPDGTFIEPRGSAGRLPWLVSGDLFLEYGYRIDRGMRVAFNLVIFNFLNRQEALLVDQTYTFDAVCPLRRGEALDALRTSSGYDPTTGECLRTDRPPAVNPEFGRPTLRQPPLSARLGLKLTF